MAVFKEIDWSRLDVWALVADAGLATVLEADRSKALSWLGAEGYAVDTVECAGGVAKVVQQLGRLLKWKQQFGRDLQPASRNLDALRDGFEWQISGAGLVLELHAFDVAWKEDPTWAGGLLSIASERSMYELAVGQRFMTLLTVVDEAAVSGGKFGERVIPLRRAHLAK